MLIVVVHGISFVAYLDGIVDELANVVGLSCVRKTNEKTFDRQHCERVFQLRDKVRAPRL